MNPRVHIIALFVTVALAAHGCGGAPKVTDLPEGHADIDEVRRRAQERPDDPNAQRAVALAEAFMPGGDAKRVGRAVGRALELEPRDERLLLLAALEQERHGRPELALDRYLAALEAARESERGDRQYVAELAAAHMAALRDEVPGYAERVGERLSSLVGEPGGIGVAARQAVGEILLEAARRRGDRKASERLAESIGCVRRWRAVGPFGPHELLGFDQTLPPDQDGPLAESYVLGPSRSERATRELEAEGCQIRLDDGPLLGAGTSYVQAEIEVPRTGGYVLRLRTPNSVAVRIDGEDVVRLDHRRAPEPWVSYHRVPLEKGTHRLTLKIATRFFDPSLRVSVTRPAEGEAFSTDLPRAGDAFHRWLRAAVAWERRDVVEGRLALEQPVSGDAKDDTAQVLELAARIAGADPLLDDVARRARARALWSRAAELDPRSWQPENELGWLDAEEGRVESACARLRRAAERWPRVPRLPLGLATLLDERGWDVQAHEELVRAHRLVPEAREPLERLVDRAHDRERHDEVDRWIDSLMAADATSTARFEMLARRRRFDEARAESERLAKLEPVQYREVALQRELRIARGRGDDERAGEVLRELERHLPRKPDWPLARADRLAAEGHTGGARELLGEAIDREPTAMADLRLRRFGLGGELGLGEHRIDGDRVLRRFERERRKHAEASEVLVLDHTVMRIFEDGSHFELTHQIRRLQSQDAVEAHRTLVLSEDALLLEARTVKSDGRSIEIDGGRGEPIIEFPEVEVGDYVEHEYVRHHPPEARYAGGVATWRFFLGGFGVPFHRSRFTVLVPEQVQPVIDTRADVPEPERSAEAGMTMYRWEVRDREPLHEEPLSIDRREHLPSVRVSVGASWRRWIAHVRDRLADRDARDPAVQRLVDDVAGSSRNPLTRARRIYGWVLREIGHDDHALFERAPTMVMRREGHRARVLRYMLRLADVPAELVMARPLDVAGLGAEAAEPDVFSEPLVMVPEEDRKVFLWPYGSYAPFGFVPGSLREQEGLLVASEAPRVTVRADVDELHAFEVDLYLREDGSARGEVVETFRGWNAIQWRERLPAISMETLKQSLEQAYVSKLVPGATLGQLDIEGLEQRDEPLVFEYVFFVDQLGREAEDGWVVPGLLGSHLTDLLIRTRTRETTQVVPRDNDMDVLLRIHPPGGVETPAELEPVELEGPNGATFSMRTEARRRTYVVRRRLRLPAMRVSPEQYGDFARFCRGVGEAEQRDLRVDM